MRSQTESGLTFLEALLVLLLLSVIATMVITQIGTSNAEKYEATRRKMQKIQDAILGTDALDARGRRSYFGYHGDFGHVPATLNSLTSSHSPTWVFNATYGVGCGWKGPYFTSDFDDPYAITTDAWGNAFSYVTSPAPPTLVSYGADGVAGGAVYNSDLSIILNTNSRLATVRGVAKDRLGPLSGRTAEIRYCSAGALTVSTYLTGADGLFTFTDIPYGVRSIALNTPARGPLPLTVDAPEVLVPGETFDYQRSIQYLTVDTASPTGCNGPNRQSVNLISFYNTALTLNTIQAYFDDSTGIVLNTVTMNSVPQNVGSLASGTRVGISVLMTIPANGKAPLELRFSGDQTSKTISALFEWKGLPDKDTVVWNTVESCPIPMVIATNPQGTFSSAASKTLTYTAYTVPDNTGSTDLVLVAVATAEDTSLDADDATITFNGKAMTFVQNQRRSNVGVQIYRLGVSGGDSGNVVATWPSTMDRQSLHAVTLAFALNAAPEVIVQANCNGTECKANITPITDGSMVISAGVRSDTKALSALGLQHSMLDSRYSDSHGGAIGNIPVGDGEGGKAITGVGYSATGNADMAIINACFKPIPVPP